MGNRALSSVARAGAISGRGGTIMRKPALELLASLPEIAETRDRWDDKLTEEVEDLCERYGDLDIGRYEIRDRSWSGSIGWYMGWLGQYAGSWGEDVGSRLDSWWFGSRPADKWIVLPSDGDVIGAFAQALAARDPTKSWGEHHDVRLVTYLLGHGRKGAPGWGSLGSMDISSDGELVGRPQFAPSVYPPAPGLARRHITAWHNLRRLLNLLTPAQLDDLDGLLQRSGEIDRGLKALGEQHIDESARPDVKSSRRWRAKLLAGFLMYNQLHNLWMGGRRENSEIARFSAAVQGYIAAFERDDISRADLKSRIGRYFTRSGKASGAKDALLKELALPLGNLELVRALRRRLIPLEVDLPVAALEPAAGAVHNELYGLLYLGEAQTPEKLLRIIKFFLRA